MIFENHVKIKKPCSDTGFFYDDGYLYTMKGLATTIFSICLFFLTASAPRASEEVELTCVKKQMATQTCHYNFTINGIRYRFIDNGCKSKKEDILKKAKEGKLALAKDWKIDCEVKKGDD